MLLKNKTAVIYGAGGSIGGAVARAFAREGADLFLVGRTEATLQALAQEFIAIGIKAYADVVDATNEQQVNEHLEEVIKRQGRMDISFNAIGIAVKQNIPLTQLATEDFVSPIERTMRTQFITATAAARVMVRFGTGTILSLTATPGGVGYPMVGGFGPACSALEYFSNQLAVELGVYGIRAVNMRSGGSPDSRLFEEAMKADPALMVPVINKMKADTMLKELPLMADIANVAVFLASDMAAKITGVTIDVTAGTTTGLNYRTGEARKPVS
jgi:3-oxoacyl-[acyl-carrier protein] reductase